MENYIKGNRTSKTGHIATDNKQTSGRRGLEMVVDIQLRKRDGNRLKRRNM